MDIHDSTARPQTKALTPLLIVYVVIQALLLAAVRLTEFTTPEAVYCRIMYVPIVLDFAMIAYLYLRFGRKGLSWRDNLIPLAFAFMLCADTFLCLINDYYVFGYIFFCCVELCYAIYLKPGRLNIIIRAVVYAALLTALGLGGMLSFENGAAILNLSLLVCNVVFAWIAYARGRSGDALLFAVGITLFFVCDGSIAARTLLTPGTFLHTVFAVAVWTAYIPAQVFILLSYVNKLNKAPQNE